VPKKIKLFLILRLLQSTAHCTPHNFHQSHHLEKPLEFGAFLPNSASEITKGPFVFRIEAIQKSAKGEN